VIVQGEEDGIGVREASLVGCWVTFGIPRHRWRKEECWPPCVALIAAAVNRAKRVEGSTRTEILTLRRVKYIIDDNFNTPEWLVIGHE
jgi:hypothetical protein